MVKLLGGRVTPLGEKKNAWARCVDPCDAEVPERAGHEGGPAARREPRGRVDVLQPRRPPEPLHELDDVLVKVLRRRMFSSELTVVIAFWVC